MIAMVFQQNLHILVIFLLVFLMKIPMTDLEPFQAQLERPRGDVARAPRGPRKMLSFP